MISSVEKPMRQSTSSSVLIRIMYVPLNIFDLLYVTSTLSKLKQE